MLLRGAETQYYVLYNFQINVQDISGRRKDTYLLKHGTDVEHPLFKNNIYNARAN